MTDPRRRIGRIGEDHAAALLVGLGWRLLARNVRTRNGEIDIISLDGAGALVFVEVKALRIGSDYGPGRPAEAVGPRKQQQVRRLARAWLAERHGELPKFGTIRFDVIGVSVGRGGEVLAAEHLESAF